MRSRLLSHFCYKRPVSISPVRINYILECIKRPLPNATSDNVISTRNICYFVFSNRVTNKIIVIDLFCQNICQLKTIIGSQIANFSSYVRVSKHADISFDAIIHRQPLTYLDNLHINVFKKETIRIENVCRYS